jgi:transposase
MKKTRRTFTPGFKAKVALEALKERSSLKELSDKYKLHPNQISAWKQEFVDNAEKVFEGEGSAKVSELEGEKDELFRQIGQLQVENTWLKKKVL